MHCMGIILLLNVKACVACSCHNAFKRLNAKSALELEISYVPTFLRVYQELKANHRGSRVIKCLDLIVCFNGKRKSSSHFGGGFIASHEP
jgi:hypothetical protein